MAGKSNGQLSQASGFGEMKSCILSDGSIPQEMETGSLVYYELYGRQILFRNEHCNAIFPSLLFIITI